jgi:prepilin-type N-terminal cleavage/methylation domain-containing protein/prepilin-type processing-associated H-X9-DG protein
MFSYPERTMSWRRPEQERRGFTLIELLVLIGIIGVMIGILLPAVQKVRQSAARTQCASNMHNIGLALTTYKDVNGVYPHAAQLPSLTPSVPSLVDVLGDYVEHNKLVFACPMDELYFPLEGISYEYPDSRVGGKRLEELMKNGQGSSTIWLLYDYSYFHGPAGTDFSRNFLYADGHVQ